MMPIFPSTDASQGRAIQQFYDAFAPFYDDFHELIDYAEWAAIILRQLDELLPRPYRLLEIGCGTGAMLEQLMRLSNQSCVGLDLSRGMLQQCQQKFTSGRKPVLVQGDMMALGFQANSFEAIVGTFSLLNMYQATSRIVLLQGIRRVLKPNGIFLTDFFTINRYHQLLQESSAGEETSYSDAAFKIQQTLLEITDTKLDTVAQGTELQDRYIIERTLTLQNHSIHKRLYFLDPQQVEFEFQKVGFQIIKITPLVPDISVADAPGAQPNRIMLVGRKP
ncbi:MAG: methyltransferase domain-containing protein [candidate division KSB1 bacterium]|nr:methyltransferase domain-containing protein [candidate division KSB1 bacterium]